MRKRWIIITLAAGLLALAITGGAILAHGPGGKGGLSSDASISRVAELLAVEESDVRDAYVQVRRENEDAALQTRLDKLVEDESITQDLADDIMEWFEDRPEDMPPGLLRQETGRRDFHRRGGKGRRSGDGSAADTGG